MQLFYTLLLYNLILLIFSKCQQTRNYALSTLLLYLAVTGKYAGSTRCCKVVKTLQQAVQKFIRSAKSNGSLPLPSLGSCFFKNKDSLQNNNNKIPQRPRITYNQELQLVSKALQLILNCHSKAVKSATMEA